VPSGGSSDDPTGPASADRTAVNDGRSAAPRPPGLVAAAVLVALEALAPIVFAVSMIVRDRSERPSNEAVYEGSTTYLIVLGLMVLAVAAGVWRARGWSFGAAAFTQLILIAVVYEMTRESFWAGAIPLGAAAAATLALLFSRPVRRRLGRLDAGRDDDQGTDANTDHDKGS
jgi:hypothetical protein